VLLLPGDTTPARVGEVWPLVRDGADLDVLLEALVAHGLRALGPFALLHGRRVVLRGSGRAELSVAGHGLTGAAVTTWAEHPVDGDERITLRLQDEPGGEPLPLVAGVVRAASVIAGTGPAAQGSAPEPEPEEGVVPVSPETPLPDPSETPPAADAAVDGSTILPAERGAHRAASSAEPGAGEVWGVLCPEGHANPPHQRSCRVCGAPLPAHEPVPVPRPALGRLLVNDGSEAVVDRTVLVGRAPDASHASRDGLAHLLRVVSPQQDISRTHLEVRVEGWEVLVVDLSSNGTWLVRPGDEPQLLDRGEAVLVPPGSLLDLGDGVTITYEAAVS
jgi:hypothetical protein